MSGMDLILMALIGLALVLAARKCVRDRKKGKSCGGNCAQCGQGCGK